MQHIRTRFAPSPTGFMHVGSVRTALFSWLLARQNNGQFVLRIEDTDRVREVAGSVEHIQDTLSQLGLDWDEGPGAGGDLGPYSQSERLDIYKQFAQQLYEQGKAYADPYTPEELQALREKAKAEKRPFLFREHRPENPPDWDGSQPLRLKSVPKAYKWTDAIMGDLETGQEVIDDFIIMKSDGYPTYNFAHIIDDHLMQISHVMRSQEFISSTPKFLNLYEALQFEAPILATLPFVMAPNGNKKLSKRDGAKDILDYIKEGYLPEALINFLATLGWNDGTEQELFSKEELISKFSLSNVQRSGARFDEQRLLWMNGQWIRRIDLDDLYKRVTDFWPSEASEYDETYKKKILVLVQDRLKTLSDLPALTSFFFKEPNVDLSLIESSKQIKKLSAEQRSELLTSALKELEASDFSDNDLTARLNNLLVSTDQKPVVLFGLIRIALTWAPFSPGLAETMNVLGKKLSLERIRRTIDSM